MQLSHGEQHGPARQGARQLLQTGHGEEPLLGEEVQEVVARAGGAGPDDRRGRLDDQCRAELALDQHETAGDAEHGLLRTCRDRRDGRSLLRVGALARDAPYGALELRLGDLDDL